MKCQRVATVALPFFSLYKPLSLPISLGMGALRTFSSVNQLLASIQQGNGKDIPYQLLQTSISVVALGGTIFAHPVGMLITTGHDIITETVCLAGYLQRGERREALVSCANIVNNALYLALFSHGGLELTIASFATQIMLGLYHSQGEYQKGNYLEATAHMLMAMIRGNQLAGQARQLQLKWKFEDVKRAFQFELNKREASKLAGPNALSSLISQNECAPASLHLENLMTSLEANPDIISKEEVITILLRYGGDPSLVIFKAANSGDQASVVKLLDYGFSSTTNKIEPIVGPSNKYWNVTDSACRGGNTELMGYLMENKKILPTREHFRSLVMNQAPNLKAIDFLLTKGYKFPQTILFDAFHVSLNDYVYEHLREHPRKLHDTANPVKTPKIEVVKFLIDRGAKIQDSGNSYTFVGEMEYIWHTLLHNMYTSSVPKTSEANEMITLLLAHGLRADVSSRWMPYTPMGTGANVNARTFPPCRYSTPLATAIQFKDIDFARALLESGVNPNSDACYWNWVYGKSHGYWNPGGKLSHLEMSRGNEKMNRLLLEYWKGI